ncbi:rhodanese-like domain-containing protein [Patiriisocius sp. Uisw_017]|jgi:rhodanese-related sulfurtransferase|uniref:rhodanese-like domain-containing protein n=1 Tax=Patiriisocius sp. Uisw_017 TaxID=3230968 RepID=UPI0039EA03A0
MKNFSKIMLIVFTVSFLTGCNSSQKNPEATQSEIIEVVAPKAMFEILSENRDAQLVDVRTDKEFLVSHLKNAQNICVTDTDFKERVASLDKAKPIYVYCNKGGRSAKAAAILKDMGFTKIYDLQGGITEWEKNNLDTSY